MASPLSAWTWLMEIAASSTRPIRGRCSALRCLTGWPTNPDDLLLLAVTVSVTMQVVGVLLVFALLVVLAATAEQLTHRPLSMLGPSVALSVAGVWGGLVLAFVGNAPASFFIVSLISLMYFSARIYRHFHSPRRYLGLPHPSRGVTQK